MRRDRERLQDIVEAIAQIERYSLGGQEAFQQEELIQVWIVHIGRMLFDDFIIRCNHPKTLSGIETLGHLVYQS